MTDPETLRGLLGDWVTVRNPHAPGSWYGRLVGLAVEPHLLLSIPDRGQTCLPQSYTVSPAEPPAPLPAADGLPDGALASAVEGADALDAYARTPQGRNLLAHALVQLARDGWLRPEPGPGVELCPDTPPVPALPLENPGVAP